MPGFFPILYYTDSQSGPWEPTNSLYCEGAKTWTDCQSPRTGLGNTAVAHSFSVFIDTKQAYVSFAHP